MHYDNIINNILAVVQFTGRKQNMGTLRKDYFDSLNEIQRYKFYFNAKSEEILFVNDIKDLVIQPTFRHLLDIAELNHENYFSQIETNSIKNNVATSFKLIDKYYAGLTKSILRLVACFLLVKQNEAAGGSSPTSLGAVLLNPSETWQEVDYADTILHESVHQSVYLDDMVNEIYAKSYVEMTASGRRSN